MVTLIVNSMKVHAFDEGVNELIFYTQCQIKCVFDIC